MVYGMDTFTQINHSAPKFNAFTVFVASMLQGRFFSFYIWSQDGDRISFLNSLLVIQEHRTLQHLISYTSNVTRFSLPGAFSFIAFYCLLSSIVELFTSF